MTLDDLLDVVGTLDDAGGDDAARVRFRRHIAKHVQKAGPLRDHVQSCLRSKGPQYHRALQDLVNHAGSLIGFDVEYGRYAGVAGEIGHDGLWKADDFALVIEVKTTDAFSIKTAVLLNYINELVSAGRLTTPGKTCGLYVVGRADQQANQLEAAIIAENNSDRLRVASVESILNLVELVEAGVVTRTEALMLLRPSGVWVDDLVALLSRATSEQAVPAAEDGADSVVPEPPPTATRTAGTCCLLSSVSDDRERTAEQAIRALLDTGWYAFGEKTPVRKLVAPGARICLYQSGKGVVAEATIASEAERGVAPALTPLAREKYPWRFKVVQPRLFFDQPVVVSDVTFREKLDAFQNRDPAGSWAWFVQAAREVTEHDYLLLTNGHQVR
ncbi:MAG: EVE domain-containing protein [Armatimonadetes bacterium]|nr:EVE domain-containing protein [Armatimonadota bacterium]